MGPKPNDNANVPNCNQTHPYYDGVACVNCPVPFVLFDQASRRCVVCDADKKYNAGKRAC